MKKGFTLIELLVVIAIIGILSGISFSAMRSGGKSLALSRSAHALAAEIRKAQEMAMAMRKVNGNTPQGYGIYIRRAPSLEIYIFADFGGDGAYNSPPDVKIENFCDTERDLCTGKVRIQNLFPPPASRLTIAFESPHPTTIIQQDLSHTEARIILTDGSKTKTIRINKSGLISVE